MPVERVKEGLRVTGTTLMLDATRRSPLSFVSHAHADHIARHQQALATPETLALLQHRVGAIENPLPLPFGVPLAHGSLTLETLPAGHMLGAAQLRVTRADGHRVVYTGDLCTAPSLTARDAEVAHCDTLVIESTFGHPRFRFPERTMVWSEVAQWCTSQFDAGIQPILLGYPMGKSQETVAQLSARGFRVVVGEDIHAVCDVYRAQGMPLNARRYDGRFHEREVAIFSPFNRDQLTFENVQVRTAVLTGWAVEPGAAYRYRADVAFPISDHADCDALVAYAKATGAREVITTHGYADDLARELKRQGVFARALGTRAQLELALSA